MRHLKAKGISLLILLTALPSWGVLSRLYPTAATIQIRCDAYVDSVKSVDESTWTVAISSWAWLGSTLTYVNPAVIDGYTAYLNAGTTTYTVLSSSWSLKDYTQMVVDQTKWIAIDKVLEDDTNIFTVWHDTNPPAGWTGYCLVFKNSRWVAADCPN
jgi:hypothetical protein